MQLQYIHDCANFMSALCEEFVSASPAGHSLHALSVHVSLAHPNISFMSSPIYLTPHNVCLFVLLIAHPGLAEKT